MTPAGWLERRLAEAEPQGLAVTYWFDPPPAGQPYPLDVRFTGTRTGVAGTPQQRDRFEVVEHVERVVPGGGRIALTSRVQGINPGTWRVTATPVSGRGAGTASAPASVIARLPRRVITTTTRFGVLAHGPSVRLISWPLLVGLGAVVAIVVQAILAARVGVAVGDVLALSALGCALGFVGAKVWYLVLHRKPLRNFLTAGACIQGFLLVALTVVVIGAAVLGLPPGVLLDVTTPGIFLGMAVGRPGCFLTGCCAGRPTGSRWGLWSSDRRLATRRFPVQLVEAIVALLIGITTLALVLAVPTPVPGAVFAGAIAAYTFARQLLFPLRTESRTRTGRRATMVICGLVLAGSLVVSLVA
ncbi:prolipoprotein diacylglyceryl transferase family protein [Amycolatopsis tucumanensis]|uniref:Phosphatidylglycerol:prolipoprotein diacylglycerol transferase n=1 Tax=Amycolatopsis tucumanensis TaxID=401106 RepID=A0ABP7JW51_9PSEU|nr:prolipoprotein diacylglyceryl transferase family protein [Amycolatopsis tucumanensis]MCF6429182.1 prolipoprotein diacylglyceryl transferase [Amycolatopsis tucumanensis]